MASALGNEVITIQLGSFSNVISKYYWGSLAYAVGLEEIDGAINFRASSKFSPRLLKIQTKGQESAAFELKYELPLSETIPSEMETQFAPSKIDLHSKSVHELADFQEETFDKYSMGKKVFESNQEKEEICDKLRFFLEEADQKQGFQLLFDVDSAFGGLADDLLAHIHDEYSPATVFAFGVTPHSPNLELIHARRVANTCLSMYTMSSSSSVYIPLSSQSWAPNKFQHLVFDVNDMSHTGAILAAGIESATLTFRLPSTKRTDMSQLASTLNLGTYMNISALSVCFPFPVYHNTTVKQMIEQTGELYKSTLCKNLTPYLSKKIIPEAECICAKGFLPQSANNLNELLDEHLFASGCISQLRSSVHHPFYTLSPFPQIFSPKVGVHGEILANAPITAPTVTLASSLTVEPVIEDLEHEIKHQVLCVPMISHLQTTKGIHKHLQDHIQDFVSNKQKYQMEVEEIDQLAEIYAQLESVLDEYSHGHVSSQ